MIRAVRSELHRSEFTAPINPQHVELLATLGLRARLELLDRRLWQNLLNYRAHMHLSLSNDL